MSSEVENDSNLVMYTLYTWMEKENDPKEGRYDLETNEVLEATALSYDRLKDAVEFLKDRGFLDATISFGGLQDISPTVEGRIRFQEDRSAIEIKAASYVYDVFLSHAGLDDELASVVKGLLEYNDIKVFATPESIESGKWEPKIEKALQRSRDIWVLLTSAALSQSVWVHQELGYFYGFQHGRGEDPEGDRCHYLFTPGTVQPGLYRELQGTPIDSFEDPRIAAEAITQGIGRDFKLPPNYDGQLIKNETEALNDSPTITMKQDGSEGHAGNSTQTVGIYLETDAPIYNVQAIVISDTVSATIEKPFPQLNDKGRLPILISWKPKSGGVEPIQFPTEIVDPRNRSFTITDRPNDPGTGELIAITFDTQNEGPVAALTYFNVVTHQKGFPEFQLLVQGAPFGFVRGVANPGAPTGS